MEIVKIPQSWGVKREPRTPMQHRNLVRQGLTFEQQFDWDNLFVDVLDIGDNRIICVGPPLYELKSEITFSDGTNILPHQHLALDRCCITLVETNGPIEKLTLVNPKGDVTFNVHPISNIFEGIGFVSTMQKDEPISWIKQWAHYYYTEYNVRGFLLYNNNCVDYTSSELKEALTSMYDDIVVEIIDWDVPFGPNPPTWDSDFAQYMQFEHCKYKYGWCASYFLNQDIDELLVLKQGLSIDDLIEQMHLSNRSSIVYGNRNIDPYHMEMGVSACDLDPDDIRFVDYLYYADKINNPNLHGKLSITKWLCIPEKSMLYQWKTHALDGSTDTVMYPKQAGDVYFAHFRAMMSHNKSRNINPHPLNLTRCSESELIKDELLELRLKRSFKNYFD